MSYSYCELNQQICNMLVHMREHTLVVEVVVVQNNMLVDSWLHSLELGTKVHMVVEGVEVVVEEEVVVVVGEVVVVVVVVVEGVEEVVVGVHMVVCMVVEGVEPFANIGRGWHNILRSSQVHTYHGTYLHTFVDSSEVLVVGMVGLLERK